ncbi:MAG: hypothetical protein KTR31_40970 [Myxococcales bacterium]|nr:hypothetical protein [Myxococcales bacterium]
MRLAPVVCIVLPIVSACESAEIVSAGVSCDGDVATFALETSLPVEFATVYSQETGNPTPQYADEHELPTDGESRTLELTLETGDASPNPNRSTLFSCPGHHGAPEGIMTYAYRIYDGDGVLADCLVQGHDPAALIDGTNERVSEPPDAAELADCRELFGTY